MIPACYDLLCLNVTIFQTDGAAHTRWGGGAEGGEGRRGQVGNCNKVCVLPACYRRL